MEKRYKLTKRTLGTVFGSKVIITDTRDIVAYILREIKDPATGERRYKKVDHSYFDLKDPESVHWDVDYPPFPIHALDMDQFHPPGRYIVKVVSCRDKSMSYGSVAYNNPGEGYTDWQNDLAKMSQQKNKPAEAALTSEMEARLQRIERAVYTLTEKLGSR
jgi:hypothetical protein